MPLQKLLIVDNNYPSSENVYGNVFVHERLRAYKTAFDVEVVGWRSGKPPSQYTYEGIPVRQFATRDALRDAILHNNADLLGFHFIEGWMVEEFVFAIKKPMVIWFHGYEVLAWHRRLFNLKFKHWRTLLYGIRSNCSQRRAMRELFRYMNQSGTVRAIFVSHWMKRIAEIDVAGVIEQPAIIPNPIDTELFRSPPKGPEHRLRVLLIRSFDSTKYANDLAITAIKKLSRYPIFSKMQFTIIGQGYYWEQLTKPLQLFSNVQLRQGLLHHPEIPKVHREHGIFLCPTRQDSQGVSMCEAMASGLVPITSRNTAIPEFVTDGVTGFLTTSVDELTARMLELSNNPERFLSMSAAAATSIRQKAAAAVTIPQEINLMKELLSKR